MNEEILALTTPGVFLGLEAVLTFLRICLHLVYCLPALLLLVFTAQAIYNLYFHPLAGRPGPLLPAATRLWWLWHSLKGDLHCQLVLLHRRYGQSVRIAPDEISYTHLEAWKEIYAARPGQLAYERDPRDYINDIPDILSSDRVRHAQIRRLFAHGFSDRALREQEPVVQGFIDDLVEQLRKRCGEGTSEPQDMALWLNLATFDTIGQLVFGESFGSLQSETLDPYIAMIFQGVKYISICRSLNRLPGFAFLRGHVLPLALYLREFFIPAKVRENQAKQLRRTKDMVDRRRRRTPKYTDLVDRLVRATHAGRFPLASLYQNSDLLLLAGSETTASCLSGALFYLATHRAVHARLAAEVRAAFPAAYADMSHGAVVRRCPYLLAVLSESLRLYPPPPTLFPRIVRAEGDVIGGAFVAGGTAVGLNQVAAGRDPANFARADEFVPERWMEGGNVGEGKGESDFNGDRREVFMPFGAGPRNCVGVNLAYLEIRVVLAKLIWTFDMWIEDDSRNWVEVQDVYMGWQKGPLNMRLKLAEHGTV